LLCQPIDARAIAEQADVAFTCLPHKAAMQHVPALLAAGLRVIDFSADYRIRDAAEYERIYQTPHTDQANLADAVYGLPELFGDDIADADLVANPGCYPTAAALAIAPLVQRSLVRADNIVINAASGVSGAGRSPKPNLHFPEVNEAYGAYGCGNHRHQPEIEQTLGAVLGHAAQVLFVPHLLPINRGILETIYLTPTDDDVSEADLWEAFEDAYHGRPFVRLRRDVMPNVAHVCDTNFCDIAVKLVERDDWRQVVVFSAEDNMIKGASGQAVQSMNIMFDLDETAGLLDRVRVPRAI
jgi:N-acetyl-gamma-glutamyl-phosphate reductase